VLDADCGPRSLKRGTANPVFGQCLLRPNGRPSQLLLSTCSNGGLPPSSWIVKKFEVLTNCGYRLEGHFASSHKISFYCRSKSVPFQSGKEPITWLHSTRSMTCRKAANNPVIVTLDKSTDVTSTPEKLCQLQESRQNALRRSDKAAAVVRNTLAVGTCQSKK